MISKSALEKIPHRKKIIDVKKNRAHKLIFELKLELNIDKTQSRYVFYFNKIIMKHLQSLSSID